ncbi:C-type lectin domain family 4 member M-like [Saccoglossus kowalevskii]
MLRLCTFLVVVGLAMVHGQDCPRYWYRFETDPYCYRFFSALQTWKDAQDICMTYGADLASVHSGEENNFISKLQGTPCENRMWIGLTDATFEGTFSWIDGTSVVYTNWGDGEPNDSGDEDCVEMDGMTFEWNDAHCDNTNPFICKWYFP